VKGARANLPACLAQATIAALALGVQCALGAGPPAAAKHAVHTIVIEAVAYRPAALTVKTGDMIVWVNKDPFPHTVTAKGAFDSGTIAAGASWKHVARRAGSHDYLCTLHPNMKGTLTVE
jgi:plastocyanin